MDDRGAEHGDRTEASVGHLQHAAVYAAADHIVRINLAQGGGYARAVEPPGLHRVHFFILRSAPAAASTPQPPSAWLERARAFRLIGSRDD